MIIITDLPLDILTLFAVHLPDITYFRRVCRRFRKATQSKLLWKQKALLYVDEQTFLDLPGSTWYQKYALVSIGVIKQESEIVAQKQKSSISEIGFRLIALNREITSLLTREEAIRAESTHMLQMLTSKEILLRKDLLSASLGLPRGPRVINIHRDYSSIFTNTNEIPVSAFVRDYDINEFDILRIHTTNYGSYARNYIVYRDKKSILTAICSDPHYNDVLPYEAKYILKKLRIQNRGDARMIYGEFCFAAYFDNTGLILELNNT